MKVPLAIASFIAGTVLLVYANTLSSRLLDEINRVRSDRQISDHDFFMNVFGTLRLHKDLFPESRLRTLVLRTAITGYACVGFAILVWTRVI